MGQRSIKEYKNYYFQSREKANLTREAAADTLGISKSRLEKIEYDKSLPYPEEAKAMATCYKNPSLCNYYCSHDCEIGKDQVAEIKEKSLSQISLEMLSTLNELSNNKERFINIVADEVISHDEMEDFNTIKENLHKMSLIVDSLNLWLEKTSIDNEHTYK